MLNTFLNKLCERTSWEIPSQSLFHLQPALHNIDLGRYPETIMDLETNLKYSSITGAKYQAMESLLHL